MVDNMNGKSINKILFKREVWDSKSDPIGKPVYEIIVKKGDEVVYHNKGYAGIINIVQRVDDIDAEQGIIEGDSQVIGFGHPVMVVFAWDQVRVKCQDLFQFAAAYMLQLQQKMNRHKQRKHLKAIARENTLKSF